MATRSQVQGLLSHVEKEMEQPVKLEKFDSDGVQLPAEELRRIYFFAEAKQVLESILEHGITD